VRCSAAFTALSTAAKGLAGSMIRIVAAGIATEPGSSASGTPFQTSAQRKLEVTEPVFLSVDSHTGDSRRVHGINKVLIYIMREHIGFTDGHISTNHGNVITNEGNVVTNMPLGDVNGQKADDPGERGG